MRDLRAVPGSGRHAFAAAVAAVLALAAGLTSCQAEQNAAAKPAGSEAAGSPAAEHTAYATFAGGCFWCMEKPFDEVPGVLSTTSGYTGGFKLDPTYHQVSSGQTGHAEALQVAYDSTRTTYAALLGVFWRNIDPLARDRQFCDVGTQYRSAIFYADEEQRRLAEESKRALEESQRFGQPIVTEIVPLATFYPAEEYHQDFYKKDPVRYASYRLGCGRDRRLKELWGVNH